MLSNPIEYLKGVGPQRGELLRKELDIHTFGDLLIHFPFRHIDRSKVLNIQDISSESDFIQVSGKLLYFEIIGEKRGKRLVASIGDKTGELSLVWFQGISWIQKILKLQQLYIVYGRVSYFNGEPQMAHPEMDILTAENAKGKDFLEPVYSSTEKLTARGLSGRMQGKLTQNLFDILPGEALTENIPDRYMSQYKLIPRYRAFRTIHFPKNEDELSLATRRLKFEELLMAQIRICRIKLFRHQNSKGWKFEQVGNFFNLFYEKYLPFKLTNAQKRVIKEIRQDTLHGKQMNRLLQGDVGSGKTMVALLSVLIAADNGFQSCIMAPTEILSQQHFNNISRLLKDMDFKVSLLTGNVKGKQRRQILSAAADGSLNLLIGTHALIEEEVIFKNLGLAIVDEQHRFGVQQRAKLWGKNIIPPHILVMTATPIPRTLAMTVYGDLDVSVINELPPGRKPIQTIHRNEIHRGQMMSFLKSEIDKGRQAYIVYPLIEESQKLDYENLYAGYELVKAYFPEPKYYIGMVHGRQSQQEREINMQRFVNGDCQIMVATTVIEVGVDVPNATVMVVESSERFGLSQLHQLRGRVGRGGEKSYCILMTGNKMSNDSRQRINTMVQTTDGFKISEKDMELRGPGDIEGTRQSGALNLHIADLVQDRAILEASKKAAEEILETDPDLNQPENQGLKDFLISQKDKNQWSKIS
ncbi:MAG: ATP-dependent DNA helicase RecG [Chitinophagaceae bacterium]